MDATRTKRVQRVLDIQLRDVDNEPLLDLRSQTLNLGLNGILMYVPLPCEAVEGEEVVATLTWNGGEFTSKGRIVRFESPYRGDPSQSVMGVHLDSELPGELLAQS